ncbi:MAG: heterodisulfide reductase-related iron-sulfur binding cluster, partial [Anaerolineales bacterium]|nr:heterodisulfide reductase-related iron-sulfur binding cluster [Anaerolineales bacterium]
MSEEIKATEKPTITINGNLAARIQEEIGENVFLCYQCVKCTSGCPVAQYFDWQPNQIMRAVQLGQEDIALNSETPWLCASCLTCTTRCPQGLNITAIMEFLTREILERGIKPKIPETNQFNKAFMREVNLWGRSYEPGLMAELIMHNPKSLVDDFQLYLKFFQKGKVKFLPHPVKMPSKKQVKAVTGAAGTVAYYPGCSLETTATEYNHSTLAVCEALDFPLAEPKGWICCGSSAAHRADPDAALHLPMENLALIERQGYKEVAMPCAACFNRHKAAQHEIRNHPDHKQTVDGIMGYEYQDEVHVSTMIEAIYNHVGTDKIAEKTKKPLSDLKLVCYYGCLLTRPPEVTEAKHPEYPQEMDLLMEALGAEVLDWSYKTTCCGAGHSLTRPDIVVDLSGSLVQLALERGAEAIVVACPLCHMNLDARQFQM